MRGAGGRAPQALKPNGVRIMKLHLKKKLGLAKGPTAYTICGRWVARNRVFMDKWQLVNKKVIEPPYEEIRANPRARSAKLRVIERI